MSLHPLLVSPFVTLLVTGLVYADAKRRALPRQTQLRWTVGVGLVSLGGFLGAYAFDNLLAQAYTRFFEGQIVVHSPREVLTLLFVVGLSISVMAVLVYGVGSRLGLQDP